MKYELVRDAEYTLLALMGSLDAQGAVDAESALAEAMKQVDRVLVVDLNRVSFVASMGIGVLLRFARTLQAEQKRMILYRPQPLVEDVLRIAGLHHLIPIEQKLPDKPKLEGK